MVQMLQPYIGSMLFRFATKHACDKQTNRKAEGQNYDPQDSASIAASRSKTVAKNQGDLSTPSIHWTHIVMYAVTPCSKLLPIQWNKTVYTVRIFHRLNWLALTRRNVFFITKLSDISNAAHGIIWMIQRITWQLFDTVDCRKTSLFTNCNKFWIQILSKQHICAILK